jgi:hypothetical protein
MYIAVDPSLQPTVVLTGRLRFQSTPVVPVIFWPPLVILVSPPDQVVRHCQFKPNHH